METKTKPRRRGFYAYSLILSPVRHSLSSWHPTRPSADSAECAAAGFSPEDGVVSPAPPPSWAVPLHGGPWVGREAPEEDLAPESLGEGQSQASGLGGKAGRCFCHGSGGIKGQECWLGVCYHGSCRPWAPPPRQWLAFPQRLCPPQSFPTEALLLKTRGREGSRCPSATLRSCRKATWGGVRGVSPT